MGYSKGYGRSSVSKLGVTNAVTTETSTWDGYQGRGYQTGYHSSPCFQEAGFQGCFHGKRHPADVNKALVNSGINTQSRGTQATGTHRGTHGKPHRMCDPHTIGRTNPCATRVLRLDRKSQAIDPADAVAIHHPTVQRSHSQQARLVGRPSRR